MDGLGIRAGCFPCKNIRKETLPEQSPLGSTNLTLHPFLTLTPLLGFQPLCERKQQLNGAQEQPGSTRHQVQHQRHGQ